MPVLVLDTALEACQAAVVTDGVVCAHVVTRAQGGAEAIAANAVAALQEAGVGFGDLARVAVTIGPGSFTGVRVGIAYAKGVAFARSIPAVGVSTLEVLARQGGLPALAVIDARHGAVYAALHTAPGVAPSVAARIPVAACLELAEAAGAQIVGPSGAIQVVGVGTPLQAIDPLVLFECAQGDPAGRAPRALYLAPVDAAPQQHKALARA
ncbi:MAG: tRNA (adenosine(37)-N6)-threonylcarbamoyltransferase complex dimerization subunit type 1 TsaB [Pseudomonadota bacterium]